MGTSSSVGISLAIRRRTLSPPWWRCLGLHSAITPPHRWPPQSMQVGWWYRNNVLTIHLFLVAMPHGQQWVGVTECLDRFIFKLLFLWLYTSSTSRRIPTATQIRHCPRALPGRASSKRWGVQTLRDIMNVRSDSNTLGLCRVSRQEASMAGTSITLSRLRW